MTENYLANYYHQVTDEYDPDWSMGGIIQQIRVMLRVEYKLGIGNAVPTLDDDSLL